MEAFIQWWRTLARRERRLVMSALAVVLIAIGYLLFFEPAWQGRQQIAKELPVMRSQVAQMDSLGAEAKRLEAVPKQDDSAQSIRRQFELSVASAGLKPFMTQISLSGDVLDVRFNGAPFAAWVVWIESALRETRLRVVDAAIQREATSGAVTVRLALEVPKRETK